MTKTQTSTMTLQGDISNRKLFDFVSSMVLDGWVVSQIRRRGWWFGARWWVVVLTKETPTPPVVPNVSLPLTVGPVTRRS